ncbi:MAG: Ig-like domain-containing protein [Erysipelotrichaceae bacterium]
MKIKKIINKTTKVVLALILIINSGILVDNILATNSYFLATANSDYSLSISESAFSSFASAKEAMMSAADNIVVVNTNNKIVAMKSGAVGYAAPGLTLTFDNTNAGMSVYIKNGYMGYYQNSNFNGSDVIVTTGISSFWGNTSINNVVLIPDAWLFANSKYYLDYYSVNNSGSLIHHLAMFSANDSKSYQAGSFVVDAAPKFMKQGVKYYSLDGVNFYTDYKGVRSGDSYVGTYYPYYRFLSYRSKTNYSAAEINSYIASSAPSNSVLHNQAQAFLSAQKNWGVNAIMELAFANLESNYGSSNYAINRFNLFGINATDSNPNGANYFNSVAHNVDEHTKVLLNGGYFDAFAFIDTNYAASHSSYYGSTLSSYHGDIRYIGSSPGSKAMGVSVKYASDPYHGEKISGLTYLIDNALGLKDYESYSIGLTNTATYAYSKADTNSWKLYQYTTRANRGTSNGPVGLPVVILGSVGDYYLIQSEMPVSNLGHSYYTWNYDRDLSVAYVLKSDIDVVRTATAIHTDALASIISNTNITDRSIYTTESLEIYDQARELAIKQMSNPTTQSAVDSAAVNLEAAYNALKEKPVDILIESINLENGDMSVTHLASFNLNATISPANATIQSLTFISSDSSVASVSAEGLVQPLKNGSATITVQANDGSGVKTSFNLTVNVETLISEVYDINQNNGFISSIKNGTTIKEVDNNIMGPELIFYDQSQVVTEGKAKTGMQVEAIVDGGVSFKYTLVVSGDVSGDGNISIGDYVLLRNHLLSTKEITGAYLAAADLNGSDSISIGDYVLLRNILLGR